MKQILKSYIKRFFKDLLISIITIFYLIFLFLSIFTIMSSSYQTLTQYHEILKKSDRWESSFDNAYSNWNFNNPKMETVFNKITDNEGIPLLMSGWKDKIKAQIPTFNTPATPADWNNFYEAWKSDLTLLLLSENPSTIAPNSNWVWVVQMYEGTSSTSPIKLSDIFNEKANWNEFNYSFNEALTKSLANTDIKNIGDNNSFLMENYYSSAKKISDNKMPDSTTPNITKTPKEVLNINFTNNNLRNNMSQVFLQKNKGHMPNKDNEILVNRIFADENGWKIGDKINLFGNSKLFNPLFKSKSAIVNRKFTIVGYGMSLSSSEQFSKDFVLLSLGNPASWIWNLYQNIILGLFDPYSNNSAWFCIF